MCEFDVDGQCIFQKQYRDDSARQSASCRTRTCSRTATGAAEARPDRRSTRAFWGGTVDAPRAGPRPADRGRALAREAEGAAEEGWAHARGAGRRRFRGRKARRKADDDAIDAEDAAMRVRAALEDGRDPRTVVTAEECKLVASVEWSSRGGPGVDARHGIRGAAYSLGILAERRVRQGRSGSGTCSPTSTSTPTGRCSASCWSATRRPRTATAGICCTCTTGAS